VPLYLGIIHLGVRKRRVRGISAILVAEHVGSLSLPLLFWVIKKVSSICGKRVFLYCDMGDFRKPNRIVEENSDIIDMGEMALRMTLTLV
jgi:hypothetical protein